MSFSFSPGMGPRSAIRQHGLQAESGTALDWRVVVGMLRFLRPYRRRMLAAVLLMLVVTGLTLLAPYLIKVAIDNYIALGDTDGLVWIVLAAAGTYLLLYLAGAGEQYILAWVGQRVLADLRAAMFRHLQVLSLSYHDTHIVGVTVSRLINDVAIINDLLTQGLMTLIGDLLVLLGILVVMLVLSPHLALVTFVVIPMMALATYVFSTRARLAFRETRARLAALVGALAENIDGIRVIQAFAQEERIERRFDAVNWANRQANVGAIRMSFVFLPTIEFLAVLSMAIVLWFGGRSVAAGTLTLGVVVAFLAYVTRFFQPVQELSRIYTTMQSAMAGGEQVLRLLNTEPGIVDRPDAVELPQMKGQIEFENVTFRYRENTVTVLFDVTLSIEAGQTVALVGPTGAGKTTIAKLIARLYEVEEGCVRVDGYDVRSVTQDSLRRQIGMIPQDPFLFSGTIEDNIRFSAPDASFERVEEAARLANIDEYISQLPQGYATPILEGAANLSVGQRQLISIARAALADPSILILDEATASVDTMTEVLIQKALNHLLAGRTAIVIAHRLSTVRGADLICVVDEGRIVERGTHQALLAADGLYRRLYEGQFLV